MFRTFSKDFIDLRKMREGKKLVLTNGCFDMLHPGHLDSLAQAASLGDLLMVAVNSDASTAGLKGEGRPVNTIFHRLDMLSRLLTPLIAFEFEDDDACEIIRALKPEIYVKGDEYKTKKFPEHGQVSLYGGRIVYTHTDPRYSTSKIIAQAVRAYHFALDKRAEKLSK